MSENEMVAPTRHPAGIGVFCHVLFVNPSSEGPGGLGSKGFYVWVGVRSSNEETALERAKHFLKTKNVLRIEIEEATVLDEDDFEKPDDIQQLGGRVYYAD